MDGLRPLDGAGLVALAIAAWGKRDAIQSVGRWLFRVPTPSGPPPPQTTSTPPSLDADVRKIVDAALAPLRSENVVMRAELADLKSDLAEVRDTMRAAIEKAAEQNGDFKGMLGEIRGQLGVIIRKGAQ